MVCRRLSMCTLSACWLKTPIGPFALASVSVLASLPISMWLNEASPDISVESVRRWVRQSDVDDGVIDGQSTSEQNELVVLRREKRRLEMENEILRRGACQFVCVSGVVTGRGLTAIDV